MRYFSLVAVLFVSAVFVINSNCGRCGKRVEEKRIEQMIEAASGGEAKVDVENIDISSLPVNLRYPNAVAQAKWEITTEEGKGINYTFETADPKAKVVEFYKSALPGWQNTMVSETPDGTGMVFSSKDKQETVVVLVSSQETKTIITLMHTKK